MPILILASPQTSFAQEGVLEQAAAVLGKRCLGCHNAEKKTGGLDLSTRLTATAKGALTSGAVEQSRVWQRVSAGTMPPDGKLPAAEIAVLRRWIAGGAPYAKEPLEAIRPARKPPWSFRPIVRPPVPQTQFDALARNPIDRFLFAEMAKKGLRPSPPASKLALLRRVTVDLTGLPPTPDEIRAFLADKSPNGYEKVVDRLLASPAYGERWGRHWLDVARYGESHGYEQNHLRPNAWPYRDYVIRAFNQDKPYDRFIAEQLAGDILGKGDPEIEVATGFLVAGIHDTVGNSTEEGTRQQRANDLDDIVTTTGATFLGLTVGCAKCHDHKFDPIPQRDFYRLAAAFAGVHHGEQALPSKPLTEAQQRELARLNKALEQTADALSTLESEVVEGENDATKRRPPVTARRNVEEFAPTQARFVRFTILATQDEAEPCLDELQIFGPNGDANLALSTNGAKASASSLLPGFPMHQIAHLNDGLFGNDHSWISGERGGGWAQIELPQTATVSRVVWERDTDERFVDRLATAYRMEVSEDGKTWRTVATGADRRLPTGTISSETLQQRMTPAQRERRAQLLATRDHLRKQVADLAPTSMAYIGQFTPPDTIYVLKRGDVMQRGETVMPGALSQITALSPELALTPGHEWHGLKSESPVNGAGSAQTRTEQPGLPVLYKGSARAIHGRAQNGVVLATEERSAGLKERSVLEPRLALARWMTDPRNPLTARVLVNRIWTQHFGRGIVGTPSDFGNNGELPSHLALLDWLASNFVAKDEGGRMKDEKGKSTSSFIPHPSSFACGWTLKRLHKLIVTSYIYRQTSAVNPACAAKDADNRFLWRMPLRRMEAEAVRDAILATSGKLDRRMGGPSYRLFKYEVVNVAIYTPLEEQGPETWRRSVYQQPARGIRDDLLGAFDCPDSSERSPRRTSTTTALQALSLLNGYFVNQQADFFAARVQQEAGTKPAAQIERAFWLAFGHAPDAKASQAAVALVSQYGLPTLCRALLNANEFLYF